ncbi:MAG: hypothetical protein J3K34DRAFT_439978 [Monoraphidium minutum]|nr:MAG: hypothetical protein J3K34DRAFT_439978 [Monoraphidium minutum]
MLIGFGGALNGSLEGKKRGRAPAHDSAKGRRRVGPTGATDWEGAGRRVASAGPVRGGVRGLWGIERGPRGGFPGAGFGPPPPPLAGLLSGHTAAAGSMLLGVCKGGSAFPAIKGPGGGGVNRLGGRQAGEASPGLVCRIRIGKRPARQRACCGGARACDHEWGLAAAAPPGPAPRPAPSKLGAARFARIHTAAPGQGAGAWARVSGGSCVVWVVRVCGGASQRRRSEWVCADSRKASAHAGAGRGS